MEAKTLTYEQELFQRARRVAVPLGSKGEIYISLGTTKYDNGSADVAVYPNGMTAGGSKRFSASTFVEALDQAEAWIAAKAIVLREKTIRTMALAIIELTDEHWSCKRQDLVRKFSEGEVGEFADAACQRATEMAGNAPYQVLP